jgi:hypothetical protein
MTKAGVALPSVLMALAISSALAVGGAFVARRAVGTVRNRITLSRLSDATEISIGAMVASLDSTAISRQQIGETLSDSSRTPELQTGTWVTRIAHSSFWVVGESCRIPLPRVCRRQGLLVIVTSADSLIGYTSTWVDLP